ncbi:MAG: metalloregulator ArsR/SmtB family transcription factor [Chloracidobacterium sp.]|uniref:Helix-turn-helix transcriptional regulator n=1 Tax=Chloracidobacterium validum TaxID=2821543 RepID=A0ABX8B9X7_9BACT|nr:metalloregulator ArsR/SmtB family transcription factor [Chloracidobacterium validum]QUW03742.1 helix-turn-helix transcriptional regulator [Chloracidobacterium validum]
MPNAPHRLSDEALELIAARFRVLAEPTRLKLLNLLRERGEMSVGEIVAETGYGQANVSKHLIVLLEAGMVARRREGTSVYYRIADHSIFALCELICAGLEAQLQARQAALLG